MYIICILYLTLYRVSLKMFKKLFTFTPIEKDTDKDVRISPPPIKPSFTRSVSSSKSLKITLEEKENNTNLKKFKF